MTAAVAKGGVDTGGGQKAEHAAAVLPVLTSVQVPAAINAIGGGDQSAMVAAVLPGMERCRWLWACRWPPCRCSTCGWR